MQQENIIKKYFETANSIVISLMYLNQYKNNNYLLPNNIKKYNPGHLGTSLSMNFILSNLYYFLNKKNLTSKIIIGTGHSGVSLITNLWLNGTLEKYNRNYSQNKQGINNLINDFGKIIRSEINPEYPETIYDGGELGYSLPVAFGYSINCKEDIIPCVIGDGEAETGTISSAWQLNKILNTNNKVLPIINLNGLKMGSPSFLSRMTNKELIMYFTSLGYSPEIIDATREKDMINNIKNMQQSLNNSLNKNAPLLIFKSYKGYTLPTIDNINYEIDPIVHKNPLQDLDKNKKLKIIKEFLKQYDMNIFDEKNNLISLFDNFRINTTKNNLQELNSININKENINLEDYLYKFLENNQSLVFSPDEIYSNKLNKIDKYCIEILNENLLQALYQGYTQAGNLGFYISYEGFVPIISSMITQYYKYLNQKSKINKEQRHSLNYILTSTCWENTYSHQNPDFVNSLLEKNDKFYNILYPKDNNNLLKCLDYILNTKDKINIITTSKRHTKIYQDYNSANIKIEVLLDCPNPDLILCATGDYMLDRLYEVYNKIKQNYKNIKIIYVTNPNVLDINSKNALTEEEFNNYFNKNIPIIYLFAGYPSIIKSLLFDRKVDCTIYGYNDMISVKGDVNNNLEANELTVNKIANLCYDKTNCKVKRRKYE